MEAWRFVWDGHTTVPPFVWENNRDATAVASPRVQGVRRWGESEGYCTVSTTSACGGSVTVNVDPLMRAPVNGAGATAVGWSKVL